MTSKQVNGNDNKDVKVATCKHWALFDLYLFSLSIVNVPG